MFNNVPKDCSDYNELIMKGLYVTSIDYQLDSHFI